MDRKETHEPKPRFLSPEVASAFQDASVVRAYPKRLPYADATFPLLVGLIVGERRVVLDVGAGTGDIARRLAPLVQRIDALDWSPAMIEQGKRQPGGDAPQIRWLAGRVEEAPLDPPYGLVTAGESLHWMDWAVVMPRFRATLAPGGVIAILHREEPSVPWSDGLLALIRRFSTLRDYQPLNLIDELARRGLFTKAGEWRSEPVANEQSIDDYIESMHSRSSFSRERMPAADLAAFDAELRALLETHATDGCITFPIVSTGVWGTPDAD